MLMSPPPPSNTPAQEEEEYATFITASQEIRNYCRRILALSLDELERAYIARQVFLPRDIRIPRFTRDGFPLVVVHIECVDCLRSTTRVSGQHDERLRLRYDDDDEGSPFDLPPSSPEPYGYHLSSHSYVDDNDENEDPELTQLIQ